MIKRLERALVAAMLATVLASSLAGTARAQANDRLAMLTEGTGNITAGRAASAPVGYLQFCAKNPADCGRGNGRGGRIQLDAAEYAQLRQVNDQINERIQPLTDLEHYGEVERWTFPDDGYGDCEDYVLLKRRTLISLGWPAETLLVAVVRDKKGDGHAVLMVATDHGDLVLDNQEAEILPWYETGYRYVKRQKQGDPDAWVSLGDIGAPATVGRN
jgi:predicted transglutaminase-like cysteine proteinase